MGEFIGLWAALSLVVTKAVDFVRNLPWFKNPDGTAKFQGSWIWNALAFVFGLIIAVGWQHGIVDDLFKQVPALQGTNLSDSANYILTGLIIGAGAGAFHEVLDALSGIGTALQSWRAAPTPMPADTTGTTSTDL